MKLVKFSERDVKMIYGNKTTKMTILQPLCNFYNVTVQQVGFDFSPFKTP